MPLTGFNRFGRPSIGSWVNYGIGSENENLPAFVVMVTKNKGGQPLVSRLWGSGFLPSSHQGVQLRAAGDPVLYLQDPALADPARRPETLRRLLADVASFVPGATPAS